MAFFRIVIPNYNNEEWLDKSIGSVLNQTFQDFFLIIVDDCSTDGSWEKIKDYEKKNKDKIFAYKNDTKRWNGGTRNVGLYLGEELSEYTLFLDSDDWFKDNNSLQKIYDKIKENNFPDCVSLSYNCRINGKEFLQPLIRNTPQELVDSLYVACWTKCIQSDIVESFPENTLMEDVVQHIKQCDKIKTIVSIEEPLIVWNRDNLNSCSREENQKCQHGKWQSSMYRYAADLMDLQCEHNYCESHRKWRLEVVLNNIKEGKYIQ